MATSKELLRAIKGGATVQNQHGEPVEYRPSVPGDRKPWKLAGRDQLGWGAGDCVAVTPVEVVPAAEKDRIRFEADWAREQEDAIKDSTVEGTFHTYLKITPEVIEALYVLRRNAHSYGMDISTGEAFDVLDNAGIFAPIDETTGYDVDPEPERVSKCTCSPAALKTTGGAHAPSCPGDPAEYGDMAYTVVGQDDMRDVAARIRKQPYQPERVGNHEHSSAPSKDRRPCPADQCTLDFAVNKDGTLHQHLNDMLRPCPGVAPIQKEN